MEVKSKRWYSHFVGDAQKYRPDKDVAAARGQDCIASLERHLLKQGILKKQDVDRIVEGVLKEIEEAVEFARKSPLPDESELIQDLYV